MRQPYWDWNLIEVTYPRESSKYDALASEVETWFRAHYHSLGSFKTEVFHHNADGLLVEQFRFKDDRDAVEFKLRFG